MVVVVVPLFKSLKVSPVLGFLLAGAPPCPAGAAPQPAPPAGRDACPNLWPCPPCPLPSPGVVLDRFGLFRDEGTVSQLAELGVLFLLFEQGLELSLDRLKALSKYAFVLGSLQVLLTTAAFTLLEESGLATELMTRVLGANPTLVSIRSVDEALVIGAGLSLSSSAFVLQLLSERGELSTPFGQATLGVLLLQDIAVVPLLVVLPLYESGLGDDRTAVLAALLPAFAQASLGLGIIVLVGRFVLRRVFDLVAASRSTDAFVALCLLTVTGTGLATKLLGLSDTLGAFLAGVLLADTNYRQQVETDIRPFRGLLLAMFFVTTGTSIDLALLQREWPNVLALTGGLIAVKTAIVAAAGPAVGLTRAESLRAGLLLGQGGEFAFVVFTLANQLDVLPEELNKLLIIVVVLSMALTPLLAEAGGRAYELVNKLENKEAGAAPGEEAIACSLEGASLTGAVIVVCGFGPQGEMLAALLRAAASDGEGGKPPVPGYVAFDLDPVRVAYGRRRGFNVQLGDAADRGVLAAAGVRTPAAAVVGYAKPEAVTATVTQLRAAFGQAPIFARARDAAHAQLLAGAGASGSVVDSAESGIALGEEVLSALGVGAGERRKLAAAIRATLAVEAFQARMTEPEEYSTDEKSSDSAAVAMEEEEEEAAAAASEAAEAWAAAVHLVEAGLAPSGGSGSTGAAPPTPPLTSAAEQNGRRGGGDR